MGGGRALLEDFWNAGNGYGVLVGWWEGFLIFIGRWEHLEKAIFILLVVPSVLFTFVLVERVFIFIFL